MAVSRPVHPSLPGRRVGGPFTYDVYLGFAKDDRTKMVELQQNLEARGIICYPRYVATDIVQSTKLAIDDGFVHSQKCVIYVSNNYLEDQWLTMESQKVVEKANRFSRDCVLLLLDAEHRKLPPVFEGFTSQSQQCTDSDLENSGFLDWLAEELRKEPNPQLTLMPKENIGYGAALGYFYGFLRLVLPGFRKRLEEITLGGDCEMRKNTVMKMLIIMPESCFCPPEFTDNIKISHTDKYVLTVAHRAGNKNRDYKSSLYSIVDSKKSKKYYFVGELATPLLTLYESYLFGLANLSREQLYMERNAFYVSLKAILSHEDNVECHDQFKLLFWPSDPEMKTGNVVTLCDFLLSEIRSELQLKNAEQSTQVKGSTPETGTVPVNQNRTFTPVATSGSNPAAVYDEPLFGCYKMDSRPRGMCLIINIVTMSKGLVPIDSRDGTKHDARMLMKLFGEKLHFTVQTHEDLSLESLETLLLTMSNLDHSRYDAFICCVLTHGKLGSLYMADCKPIRILDITDYFNDRNCHTLRGKPKLFFIQACQAVPEAGTGGTNPPESLRRDDITTAEDDYQAPLETQMAVSSGQCDTMVRHDTGESAVETDASTVRLVSDASWAPTLVATNPQTRATLVPSWPDFVMSYATLPGSLAYRDPDTGSLYINELTRCLVKPLEIDRALKLVTQGVREWLAKDDQKMNVPSRFQLPFHLQTGTGKLLRLN